MPFFCLLLIEAERFMLFPDSLLGSRAWGSIFEEPIIGGSFKPFVLP
jgi:hypothetical protein